MVLSPNSESVLCAFGWMSISVGATQEIKVNLVCNTQAFFLKISKEISISYDFIFPQIIFIYNKITSRVCVETERWVYIKTLERGNWPRAAGSLSCPPSLALHQCFRCIRFYPETNGWKSVGGKPERNVKMVFKLRDKNQGL